MGKVRFAIVGTNNISCKFAEAAEASQKASLVAVFSRKLDTGSTFASKYGIKKVYTSYSEMLSDSEIDAVYIASPTMCHFEHSRAALLASKHVLCEKMICLTAGELRELRAIADSRGLVLLEAMRPDFDPAYDKVREGICALGKIRRATFEYCQYSSRYDSFLSGTVLNAFDPKMKNSALADIGIYPLHMAVSLFGAPERLSAKSIFLENGFEACGNIILEYPDSIVGIVYSKISASVNPSVIEGEGGSLTIDKISTPTEIILHLRKNKPERLALNAPDNNMIYEIEAFSSMISFGVRPDRYLDISEITLSLVEEAYGQTGALDKM